MISAHFHIQYGMSNKKCFLNCRQNNENTSAGKQIVSRKSSTNASHFKTLKT